MTEYVILRKKAVTEEDVWEQAKGDPIKASSAQRAIVAAQVGGGEYIAVPARSWRPVTVKVESTVKVTIG